MEFSVTFQSGKTRNFDLLVGADGLHSNVRKLVFGNESQFEKYYGYYTSSFTIDSFSLGNHAFSMYNVPYKQVAVFSKSGNSTTTFFIFASPDKLPYQHHDILKQKQILKSEFEHSGWKCGELLSQIDSTTDFYFDSVSQIKMNSWYKDRVTLVGDAGYCPSLLSGKGSTLAMVGAYILAGELKQANGNYKTAFERCEILFKTVYGKKAESCPVFCKIIYPQKQLWYLAEK